MRRRITSVIPVILRLTIEMVTIETMVTVETVLVAVNRMTVVLVMMMVLLCW